MYSSSQKKLVSESHACRCGAPEDVSLSVSENVGEPDHHRADVVNRVEIYSLLNELPGYLLQVAFSEQGAAHEVDDLEGGGEGERVGKRGEGSGREGEG